MSAASKATLVGACISTVGIISFVHWSQQDDRRRLRQGVIKDIERQERKRQNLEDLKEQQRLQQYFKEKEEQEMSTTKLNL